MKNASQIYIGVVQVDSLRNSVVKILTNVGGLQNGTHNRSIHGITKTFSKANRSNNGKGFNEKNGSHKRNGQSTISLTPEERFPLDEDPDFAEF